ncbi:MAG: hypothetical protein GKS00_12385 [Alphaproteobacteria bacterium]|nr:hypothetical protein [Alphaproteobacteria bacterium]
MWKSLTVLIAVLLVAGCLRDDRLRPSENGVWIGVKNTSYDDFWKAANKVMAKRTNVAHSDQEMGQIVGRGNKGGGLWNDSVAFFVWPTDNSDAGYSVDVGGYVGSVWSELSPDWKKVIIDDLRKELGAS